jgi:hypothetical protein
MQTGTNNSEILTIKEPTIKLSPIQEDNYKDEKKSVPDTEKVLGSSTPLIRINTFKIDSDSIIKFKINSVDFIPTLELSFADTTYQFEGDFPKDGDLVEIYIRSRNNNKFKKIRIDFDITNITGRVSSEGGPIYSIKGIMRIPDIFSEQQVSLTEDTSYNHLLEICDLVSLGFASNDTKTDDKMPRFNPNNTIKDFIKKTIDTCYKDDESFFTSYIDLYYYLCFVNVNTLFSMDTELEDGTFDSITTLVQDKDSNGEEGVVGKILFTNHIKYAETTNYIQEFALFNNSGEIWMSNGYKRYSQFMDMDNFQFQSFFVDPITTDGAESEMVLLKGRKGDNSYERQNKYVYLGRMYSTENEGNLHPNYHFAKILNYQNNAELNKMGLTIKLTDISSNIFRYKRIPVEIYRDKKNSSLQSKMAMEQADKERNRESNEQSKEDPEQKYDRAEQWTRDGFLSGFYVVRDYSILWDKTDGFTQVVNLIRREWPVPNSAGTIKKIN